MHIHATAIVSLLRLPMNVLIRIIVIFKHVARMRRLSNNEFRLFIILTLVNTFHTYTIPVRFASASLRRIIICGNLITKLTTVYTIDFRSASQQGHFGDDTRRNVSSFQKYYRQQQKYNSTLQHFFFLQAGIEVLFYVCQLMVFIIYMFL